MTNKTVSSSPADMGRPPEGNRPTQVRLAAAVRAKIEEMCGKKGMAKFIRDAINAEMGRRGWSVETEEVDAKAARESKRKP